jgi:hypothetical protein
MVQSQKTVYASGINPNKILEKKIQVYDEPDLTFSKWGHVLRPLLVPNAKGIVTKAKDRHWEKDGTFEDFIRENTVFYPNEPLGDHLKDLLKKDFKDKMQIVDEHESHNGRSHYWECLSDKFNKDIKGSSLKVGDTVQVGMIVRNGIQTDIALGIDIFTKRLSCTNGMISKHPEGNISIAHIGSFESMREKFLAAIPIAINAAKNMIEYYQQSAYVKTSQRIAENFYTGLRNRLTPQYFPDDFNLDIDLEKKEPEKVSKIVRYEPHGEKKLWDMFNNFTEKIWHADKIVKRGNGLSFTGKRNTETQLHKVLIAQIPQR